MKTVKIQIAIVLLLFLSSIGIQAQSTQNMSLENAKNFALQYNKSLRKNGLSVAIAQKARWEAISKGLPHATASFSYQNMMGYELALFDGMPAFELEPSSNLQIQATQLIFNGGYWVGLKMSKLAEEMSVLSYKKSELDICKEVNSSYHAILVSQEMKKILSGNLVNMKVLLANTQQMVEVGVSEQINADQLSVQVATMENNIKSVERQTELAMNMLRLQLGLDVNTEITLSDSLNSFVSDQAVANLLLYSFNLSGNYNMQLVNKTVELAQKEVCLTKSNYLPTISGYYNFTHKIQTSGFDMTPPHVIGLSASMPLFTSGENCMKVKQAKLKLKSAELDKQNITDQMLIQEKQLRFNLKNAYDSYLIQQKNIEVSNRVFQNITKKYEQGVASGLDITNANNNLLMAQSSYISSILQLLNAESDLENLLGKK